MAFIEWTPTFSVGTAVLDEQHQGLIALINELHATILRKGTQEELRRILKDLLAYTESHFKCEEALMRQACYPRSVAHHVQHQEFIRKIRELYAQSLGGKFTASIDLLGYLRGWLSEHILGADQQYVPSLKMLKGEVACRD